MTTEPAKQHGGVISVLARLLKGNELPEPPPTDPMPLLLNWFNEASASGVDDDFNAMTLSTATPSGIPSALGGVVQRIVHRRERHAGVR